jgi:hypothetical protein
MVTTFENVLAIFPTQIKEMMYETLEIYWLFSFEYGVSGVFDGSITKGRARVFGSSASLVQ